MCCDSLWYCVMIMWVPLGLVFRICGLGLVGFVFAVGLGLFTAVD